jgi:hypothetical protein
MGLTASTAEALFHAGVDVITSGNHIWDKKEIYPALDRDERILRPHNYGHDGVPGRGWGVYEAADGTDVAVLSFQGRTYMIPIENPFTDADRLRRAVSFTLSTPGVVAFCTPGDTTILPAVLEAAAAYEPMVAAQRDALLTEASEWPLIFPIAEHAR